jgi:hypothetical protein
MTSYGWVERDVSVNILESNNILLKRHAVEIRRSEEECSEVWWSEGALIN